MSTGFDGSDLPDGVHFGRVIVYRQWRVVADPDAPLSGLFQTHRWRPGWNTAACRDGPLVDTHRAAAAGCTCGYWGYWLPHSTHLTGGGRGCVFGVCEVAGRVRVGLLGVRAEHARVLGVVAIHDRADWLRAADPDLAVYSSAGELIAAVPPVDAAPFLGQTAEDAYTQHLGAAGAAQVAASRLAAAVAPDLAQAVRRFGQAINHGAVAATSPNPPGMRRRRNLPVADPRPVAVRRDRARDADGRHA